MKKNEGKEKPLNQLSQSNSISQISEYNLIKTLELTYFIVLLIFEECLDKLAPSLIKDLVSTFNSMLKTQLQSYHIFTKNFLSSGKSCLKLKHLPVLYQNCNRCFTYISFNPYDNSVFSLYSAEIDD